MSYEALRNHLRATRRERGLTQAELAARSGTSRVTIARLEAGSASDVRVGTIIALGAALGLEFSASPPGAQAALETVAARERARCRRLELRLGHARLAARLLYLPRHEARALVARARGVVERWERENLCSRHYVSRWRRLLDGSPVQVAQALLEPVEWQDALFQNTPWTFAPEFAAA